MDASLTRQMITWTLALVVILAMANVYFLLQPPDDLEKPQANAEVSVLPSERLPASLQNQDVKIETTALDSKSLRQAVDLSIPCSGAQQTVFTNVVHQVRLSGAPCKKSSQLAPNSSTIRNEKNGFSATVFTLNGKGFTTDYISLEEGQNRISILHKWQDGTAENRVYMIELKAPEAKKSHP